MDIIKKRNAVKSSGSNFSLSSSFNAVRMHDLKESTDDETENWQPESETFPAETASTSKVYELTSSPDVDNNAEDKVPRIPLRRASSDLATRSSPANNNTSNKLLENRLSADFPKLNAKLQNLANDTKQFIRRRTTHLVPKNETPYAENDKKDQSDKDRAGSPSVELAQEAADVDRQQNSIPYSALSQVQQAANSNEQPPNDSDSSDNANSKSKPSNLWLFVTTYWRQICGLILLSITVAQLFPNFLCGLLWGFYLSAIVFRFVFYLYIPLDEEVDHRWAEQTMPVVITEDDLMKVDKVIYKGWMNLLLGPYHPSKTSLSATRSVLLRLDRDVVRLSIPKTNVMKHTFWNETKIEPTFTSQELYNISGASISVRPKNLARRRWWSRKYPICITFAVGAVVGLTRHSQSDTGAIISYQEQLSTDESDVCTDEEPDSQSYASKTLSAASSLSEFPTKSELDVDSVKGAAKRKRIFLFARSGREKEQWFHQLRKASGQYSYKMKLNDERKASSESESDKVELNQKALDWILYSSIQKQFARAMETLIPEKFEPKDSISMDLGIQMWKPTNRVTAEIAANQENITWANALAARIFLDFSKDPTWIRRIKAKIDSKLATLHLPYFIETLKLANLELGSNTPKITGVYEPKVNEWGLWVDVNIEYSGGIHLVLETKLNLMKLKTDESLTKLKAEKLARYSDEDVPESPESSSDEDDKLTLPFSKKSEKKQESPKESKGKKILSLVDKITHSKYFQGATENKYIKKLMQGVSDTPLNLIVDVVYVEGTLAINIPAPPSDRIWYGFRCPPKIVLKARPKVGDRSLNLTHVTDWIENKLCFLLEKFLVVPNMDDLVIPLMSGSPLFKNINQ